MKKLFSIIMCVLMVMCFMPSMAFAATAACDGTSCDHEVELTIGNTVTHGTLNDAIDEALKFYGSAERFYLIGDCNKPGSIQTCMRSAFASASQI